MAALCAAALPLLAGCTPAGIAIGAGATAATMAMEDRGFEQALKDTNVAASIHKAWLEEDASLSADLNVTVRKGVALLTGKVKTPEDRVVAAKLAWQVDGITRVVNEIETGASTTTQDFGRSIWISNSIKNSLLWDGDILDINYAIDVVNKTVYIMGIAQNAEELQRVLDHVRATPYVRRYVNLVRIKPATTPPPATTPAAHALEQAHTTTP
jgi:osmotically-inducible protein OsmY